MTDKYENKFILKIVNKSTDEDYSNALRIYKEETPKEIYTNSDQITHWLDKKTDFSTFEMIIFMLYLDDKLIGFSQIIYIKRQEIVILDYISLKEPYRVNSVFLVFLSMIQNYIISSGRQAVYYIAEIGNKDNGTNIDRESAFYKRVICLENFGCIKSLYYNLPLGIDNYESEFESLMYIKTNDNIQYINKETFLAIVHAICYDYYLAWYTDFLVKEELEIYKNKLDTYYDKIQNNISDMSRIKIEYSICPLFSGDSQNNTHGAVPAQKKKVISKTPLIILLVLMLPVVLTFLYKIIFSLLNIEFDNISSFIANIITTAVTLLIAIKYKGQK